MVPFLRSVRSVPFHDEDGSGSLDRIERKDKKPNPKPYRERKTSTCHWKGSGTCEPRRTCRNRRKADAKQSKKEKGTKETRVETKEDELAGAGRTQSGRKVGWSTTRRTFAQWDGVVHVLQQRHQSWKPRLLQRIQANGTQQLAAGTPRIRNAGTARAPAEH